MMAALRFSRQDNNLAAEGDLAEGLADERVETG